MPERLLGTVTSDPEAVEGELLEKFPKFEFESRPNETRHQIFVVNFASLDQPTFDQMRTAVQDISARRDDAEKVRREMDVEPKVAADSGKQGV